MWEGGIFVFLLHRPAKLQANCKIIGFNYQSIFSYILVVFEGGTKYQTFKIFLTENSGSLDWRIDYLSQEKLLSWPG